MLYGMVRDTYGIVRDSGRVGEWIGGQGTVQADGGFEYAPQFGANRRAP